MERFLWILLFIMIFDKIVGKLDGVKYNSIKDGVLVILSSIFTLIILHWMNLI